MSAFGPKQKLRTRETMYAFQGDTDFELTVTMWLCVRRTKSYVKSRSPPARLPLLALRACLRFGYDRIWGNSQRMSAYDPLHTSNKDMTLFLDESEGKCLSNFHSP